MGALSIRNVRKSYGTTEILKGINIEIEEGEFLILVGPSGCGKSTLLSMIAGLDSITSGEVHIGGRMVNNLSPKDRDIAMVFQSYALYPNMTVRQNISFGLEIRKVPKAEQQKIVAQVAQILQMEQLLDRKPSQLSGGQRQRVAMGRAIARDPTLFLFDEPLSNLDAKLRVEMRTEIKLLHKRVGKTIVYVTHDQIEAMTLGDKIAVMKAGEVMQFGTPQQIYDNPGQLVCCQLHGFTLDELHSLPGRQAEQHHRIETGNRWSDCMCFRSIVVRPRLWHPIWIKRSLSAYVRKKSRTRWTSSPMLLTLTSPNRRSRSPNRPEQIPCS